jgi:3D (Asp-Asp-Asp) domain-containing protein
MQYHVPQLSLTGACLGALLAATGCSSGATAAEAPLGGALLENIAVLPPEPMPAAAPEEAATRSTDETPAADRAAELGTFQLTYYWLAEPRGSKLAKTETLFHRKGCKTVATVSPTFARRLRVEGGGRLSDGRVVSTSGTCDCPSSPCYFEPGKHKRWGVGVGKRALSPFRSVAVDPTTVSIGTMLYIPALDGLSMPGAKPWGGFVHDGCVIADDRGGSVRGRQLDFFMAQRRHYTAFDNRHHLKKVTVLDGAKHCKKQGRSVVARADRNSI